MSTRRTKLTDRYGAEVDSDDVARFGELWDALEGDDPEHDSVSLRDEDEWNLNFRRDDVLFENVGDDGDEVGQLPIGSRDEALAIAAELIAGDFDALRSRPWA